MDGAGRARLVRPLIGGAVALLALSGLVMLVSSNDRATVAETPSGEPSPATTGVREPESPGIGSVDDLDEPPNSTLAFKEQREVGALGSYCYGSVCADAAGIQVPPEEEALTAPAGGVLIFEYGGEERVMVMGVGAHPIKQQRLERYGSRDFLAPDAKTMETAVVLRARRDGDRWRLPADLVPDEYVLDVFVDIPKGGNASYSFRLLVEPT